MLLASNSTRSKSKLELLSTRILKPLLERTSIQNRNSRRASRERFVLDQVPRIRHPLSGQAHNHEVTVQGNATTTCCVSASALGVSHALDGSHPEKLAYLATLPDKVHNVSFVDEDPKTIVANRLVPSRLQRPTDLRPPVTLKLGSTLCKAPLEESHLQSASTESHTLPKQHLSPRPMSLLAVARSGCSAAHDSHRARARLQGVRPIVGPDLGASLLRRPKALFFHGFLVPLRDFSVRHR
jgi:hypothetical protein